MKKIIIILVLSILSINLTLLGQTISNPEPLWNLLQDTILKRTTNKFIRGWNWGNIHKNIDEAMYMNTYHHSNVDELAPHLFVDSALRIEYPELLGSWSKGILQGISMQYDVEVDFYEKNKGDTLSCHKFQKKDGDETGAVFGFKYINYNFVNTDNLVYASIKKDPNTDMPLKESIKILEDPYPDDKLNAVYYQQFEDGKFECLDTLKNGMQWYISLKMRADEEITLDIPDIDEPVLTIKLPYKYRTLLPGHTTANEFERKIYFDSVPMYDFYTGSDAKDRITASNPPLVRGMFHMLEVFYPNYPDSFVITKRMLYSDFVSKSHPLWTDEFTFSAFFRTDGCKRIKIDTTKKIILPDGTDIDTTIIDTLFENDDNYADRLAADKHNLLLKTNDWQGQLDVATNMGIEVYYHNNCDISIDWIRFETPHARKIFRGELDMEVSAE